jgi:hypothetical protein
MSTSFGQLPSIKFHEVLFCRSKVLTCGQTDMEQLIGVFLQVLAL